ncbi:MAG: hypothetical protein D6B25_02215, partial [Desulfobulbaceae bacterium]
PEPLSDLPRGKVGRDYNESVVPATGVRSTRYNITKGKLPPGLSLDRLGRITGIPAQAGKFRFTVQAARQGKANFFQQMTLIVDPGDLVVNVSPPSINVTKAGSTGERVTFTVVQPTVPIAETITSSRGEFHLNGRVLGFYNRPLSINLNQQSPSATESITVPPSVVKNAQGAGQGIIRYRRTFTSRNVGRGTGEAEVNLRSAAAGDLKINRLRLYFEQNNRPIIAVETNSRDLKGAIDIHYNGSGSLKGYWQVDRRIIQRIQKNLFYGKILTLKTPDVPPLPTYSEGAHRLMFIITEPAAAAAAIDFPQAIYHVEAKQAEIVVPLELSSPDNFAELSSQGATFTWSEVRKAQTYQLAFFSPDSDKPIFTAYTQKGSYQLPAKVIELNFSEGQTYQWQVRGFNSEGIVAAQSTKRNFSLVPKTSYVPGQILFMVDDTEAGRALIATIADKHGLEVVEQTVLKSLQKIMVLCTTNEAVMKTADLLRQEPGLYHSQPNIIFSTLNQSDPLRSMQAIDKLLELEALHQRVTGKGVRVAVVDTGVDIKHQDLQDRVIEHRNFIRGSPYRAEIHGTAIAGLIAGSRNEFGIIGIAPDAKLLAYRACSQSSPVAPRGTCDSVSIAKALDQAISSQAQVINLSLGTVEQDLLIAKLIEQGARQQITFVAPVGNEAGQKSISFPASHPQVVGVAGLGQNNNPFPNRSIALQADAVAPAEEVFTTIPENRHNFFKGTSFSAATITGIIALSLEKNNGTPSQEYPQFDENHIWTKQVATYMGL